MKNWPKSPHPPPPPIWCLSPIFRPELSPSTEIWPGKFEKRKKKNNSFTSILTTFRLQNCVRKLYFMLRTSLKGAAPPTKNLHILCSISKWSTIFWKIKYASCKKLFKELKNGIEILVGQVVLSYRSKQPKCWFWINNTITAWPTLTLMLFLSSLHSLL